MKLLGELFSNLFLLGLVVFLAVFCLMIVLGGLAFVGRILFYVFYPLYFLTLKPVVWAIGTVFQSRCPECKQFFQKKLVDYEVASEQEVRKTVNRVDEGIIYSNQVFVPNMGYEINRQEQVSVVEKVILNHWECKNPLCGHKWQTEEFSECEGSLENKELFNGNKY